MEITLILIYQNNFLTTILEKQKDVYSTKGASVAKDLLGSCRCNLVLERSFVKMGLFRMLFSKYKNLVYTAFGNEKYFKIAGKLKEDGVPYQTVIVRNPNVNQTIGHSDNTQYDIYVKEGDKHKAQHSIHK
ncbi:hypothetical protein [Virgibacillus sp. DJP39]|uniref:hypothetical protein n=1 Tax=Virgibacillus sp. DJP39 TaxID=3409790 RepID=UPI003BB6BC60